MADINLFPAHVRYELGIAGGIFSVKNGFTELSVETPFTPHHVWLDVVGTGGTGCGQSPKNSVLWSDEQNGILFVCDIGSEAATVEWVASAHHHHHHE